MKVFELATELEVDVEAVMQILGKEDKSENVSGSEAAKVRKLLVADAAPVAAPKQRETVRFWSDVKRFSFMVPVRAPGAEERAHEVPTTITRFKDFRLTVLPGSIAHKTLLNLKDPEVRIVVDKPFEELGQAKAFREKLEDGIYTGKQRQASTLRGISYVMALFNAEERNEAAKALTQYGVGGLIELAVRKKSYIEAPYEEVR